jgi:hypothetical protein
MSTLLSTFALSMMLLQTDQRYPQEYYQLPEDTRNKATLIFRGTFGSGRTPCFFRPDGTRVWFKDSWFNVKQIYLGEVGRKSIRINTAMLPANFVAELKAGEEYLVLLHPDDASQSIIASDEGLTFQQSLRGDDIVAILKVK